MGFKSVAATECLLADVALGSLYVSVGFSVLLGLLVQMCEGMLLEFVCSHRLVAVLSCTHSAFSWLVSGSFCGGGVLWCRCHYVVWDVRLQFIFRSRGHFI